MDLFECFRNQTWSFTSSPWPGESRPATSGSSQRPIPGWAFGPGFEIVQLSDWGEDTPSILLNSGEDECDSCLGLTFPVGSDPPPGWALFPRGHLLSISSPQGCYWSMVPGNPGCSLSWEELCAMESPQGVRQGLDSDQHQAAPAQDTQALNPAEPFPLLGRGWMPRLMDSETSARAPLPVPAPLQGTSALNKCYSVYVLYVCCAKLLQLCQTLCDPMDCSPPGSPVHGILQARILEWVTMPSSRGSSQPRDQILVSYVSCIGRWVLYH